MIRKHNFYKSAIHHIAQQMGYAFIISLLLTACHANKFDFPHHTFTPETILPHTPIKDQGNFSICWIYGLTSWAESEILTAGDDSINLSTNLLLRKHYINEYQRIAKENKDDDLSTRGIVHTAIPLLQGFIFNDTHYPNKAETDEKTINNAIEEIIQDRETNSDSQQLQALNTLLDSYLSPLPSSSSDTTSISLNIEAYTSFTHHPFYAECKLELPDDKVDGIYLNLPIDSLMSLLVSTLHDGHTVIWEGDISERGFSQQQGLALLSPDISTTQASRQKEFENKKTTDDHVMHIVGIATNEEDKRFFLAKNSWGKSGRFRGYIFLSEEYVKLKTIALYCATNNKPNQKQNTYNINFSYTTK